MPALPWKERNSPPLKKPARHEMSRAEIFLDRRRRRVTALCHRALLIPEVRELIVDSIEEILAPRVVEAITATVLEMQRKGLIPRVRTSSAGGRQQEGGTAYG